MPDARVGIHPSWFGLLWCKDEYEGDWRLESAICLGTVKKQKSLNLFVVQYDGDDDTYESSRHHLALVNDSGAIISAARLKINPDCVQSEPGLPPPCPPRAHSPTHPPTHPPTPRAPPPPAGDDEAEGGTQRQDSEGDDASSSSSSSSSGESESEDEDEGPPKKIIRVRRGGSVKKLTWIHQPQGMTINAREGAEWAAKVTNYTQGELDAADELNVWMHALPGGMTTLLEQQVMVNKSLPIRGIPAFDLGELMTCHGIHYATAVYGSIDELFRTTACDSDATVPMCFGEMYGISKKKFAYFRSHCALTYVDADSTDPWKFSRPWNDRLNKERPKQIHASYMLTFDEEMMCWVGRSKHGLETYMAGFCPHQTHEPRKPEPDGVENKCINDQSGIRMWTEPIEGKVPDSKKKYRDEHKATVALQLRGLDRFRGGNRLVIADSWFANIDAILAVVASGNHYTGKIKTGYALFPHKALLNYTPTKHGAFIVYKCEEHDIWAVGVRAGNKKVSMYVTSSGTTHFTGTQKRYVLWGEDGERIVKKHDRCGVDAQYSAGQPTVDVHNKLQAGLGLMKSYRPKNFEQRVFQHGMGELAVDGYYMALLVPRLRQKYTSGRVDFKKYCKKLISLLLRNEHRSPGHRARCKPMHELKMVWQRAAPTAAASDAYNNRRPHSVQVSFHSMINSRGESFRSKQGWCKICNTKTSYFCPDCGALHPICRADVRPECGTAHLRRPNLDLRKVRVRGHGAKRTRAKMERALHAAALLDSPPPLAQRPRVAVVVGRRVHAPAPNSDEEDDLEPLL